MLSGVYGFLNRNCEGAGASGINNVKKSIGNKQWGNAMPDIREA
jgi:hypothetical protein